MMEKSSMIEFVEVKRDTGAAVPVVAVRVA
jgi:hypothetical protein